jgi:YesN/AraC family two-component response regulator
MEIKTLKELAKNLTVLYMEDEAMIRQQMEDILKNIFKSVTAVTNGQEGVDAFIKTDFDIVVTDIQMPQKNGLDAAREIKAISPHTPIVVTTAYSDINLFLTSIEIGVDRYILKPISVPNLFGSLQAACEGIINRQKAEELNKKKLLEEINQASADIAQKLADVFPNPAIALSNKKLKFVNEAFAELLGEENLKTIKSGEKNLSNFFEQRDGFLRDMDSIDENDYSANRAIIKTKGKKQIFLIAKKKITIADEQLDIYTLSNITKIEYQKLKNQNYAELLEEILFTRYKQVISAPAEPKIEARQESKSAPAPKTTEYLYLSEEEKEILRKSHQKKYSAIEYIAELDQSLIDEIDEFEELEREWSELISDFDDSANWVAVEKIAKIIQKYSKTIASLIEFEDLSYALNYLAKVLIDTQPNEENRRVLLLFLDNIRMDLCDWRDRIFIKKNTSDIHYLDSSLFSSCLQLQLKLGNPSVSVPDDDNDLELF